MFGSHIVMKSLFANLPFRIVIEPTIQRFETFGVEYFLNGFWHMLLVFTFDDLNSEVWSCATCPLFRRCVSAFWSQGILPNHFLLVQICNPKWSCMCSIYQFKCLIFHVSTLRDLLLWSLCLPIFPFKLS